jgi:hypothetical protein
MVAASRLMPNGAERAAASFHNTSAPSAEVGAFVPIRENLFDATSTKDWKAFCKF